MTAADYANIASYTITSSMLRSASSINPLDYKGALFTLVTPVASGPCPIGTYNAMEGLREESACSPCKEGYYCATTGLTVSTGSGMCNDGYFCISKATTATPNTLTITGDTIYGPCPAHHYC
jgi:hypothetical protein